MTLPRRSGVCLAFAVLVVGALAAAEPDPSDYRTVDKAVTTKVAKAGAAVSEQPAFFGVALADGGTIADVAADSPAAKAGLRPGDVLRQLDGRDLAGPDAFHEVIRTKSPGEALKLKLERDGKPLDVTATLAAPSRPLTPGRRAPQLGVAVVSVKDGEGVTIEQVVAGSAAERAKLKVGEVILKFDEADVPTPEKLRELVAARQPDDPITLTLLLAEKRVELKLRLGAEGGPAAGGPGRRGGWDTRGARYWTKPGYRIAIINVEYPDVKHNPKIPAKAWEEAMFSKASYKTTATGQPAHGSLHDYYWEQSYGRLKVEGKSFEPVEVSKKRMEYSGGTGNNRALLTEALDKLLAREGKDALKDFDGVFFIYASERASVARGSLYWPHRASVTHNGKRWDYFICAEGGARMGNISVFCHEFGHMLGLPDLYARPENPGMEGVGIWSAMANQAGNGRPQHFDAWSKEKLGWLEPAVIDPTVKQKLILAPVEDSPKECVKVLVRPDGSEYFLLENRRKKGFDSSLPAEGLLIWRVVGNRPILEESHGVEGPAGPRTYLDKVPFPSSANDAFTPVTTPSSRAQLGGGKPVYITNIRRLADGRIAFQVGYEYQ
jgi:M6 family metalloprotease-like protein